MLIEDVLTEFKRTHLEHIEDIIITDGYVGGQAVVEYFRGLLLTLKGTSSEAMSVSVKWDGAPAVVCGTNPDNGQFFVGTKSVFAQAAKINYTKKDIAKNHGTDALGQKLLKCLVHLKKLNIQGVVQGDLLFIDDSITRKNIDGKPNLTFTPNTITYAVPEGSELSKQITDVVRNGPPLEAEENRLANNLNMSFSNVDGEALMMSMREIAVSSGSACSSTNPEPSHVLRSIGLSDDMTRASLRFGLGRFNTFEEVDFVIDLVASSVSRLRAMKTV